MTEDELSTILKNRSPYEDQLHFKSRRWSKILLLTGIVTTIGSANLAGYNIGVINAPTEYIKDWINQTYYNENGNYLTISDLELRISFVVSIFLIGAAIGSLGGSFVANKIGRRGSYLICTILFMMGSLSFYECRTFESVGLLILGRFLVGLASGITTTCLPMYLSEIAPLQLRGTLGVFCSMGMTAGVVVGQIFSLPEIFGTAELWHVALSFQFIIALICTIPYPFFPESPRYILFAHNDRSRALRELIKLCDTNEMAERELSEIEPFNDNDDGDEKPSLFSVLTNPKLMLPLILVCAMQGGQQMSGINAVFFYSVIIFESIGLSARNAKWANLGVGCVNLFVAFFSPYLMENCNRRPLMLFSCTFCSVFLVLLSTFYSFASLSAILPILCVVSIFGYIIVYQVGLGPIPFFAGSELFEVGPRPVAMSMGSLSSWFCNFMVGMTFLPLRNSIGASVFLIFAVVCAALAGLLKVYMPETRGKDTSEISVRVSNGFRSKPLADLTALNETDRM